MKFVQTPNASLTAHPTRAKRREEELCGYSRPHRSITTSRKNSTFIEKLPVLSHIYPGGTVSQGVIPGYEERGKTRWRNETTTSPSPPTGAERAHPPEFTSFYPCPQSIHPSPRAKKGLFLKMLVGEASAVAIELLFGSQGWIPVSDVIHSLIS